MRRKKPDLVKTRLYHSDLIGGLSDKLADINKIYLSIRQSNIDVDSNKRSTIWVAKACAKLSSWLPDKIIVCSHAAHKSHQALGYSKEKMLVIPNGVDLDEFRPDPEARKSVRKELKLDENALLVGLVARFDPQKDHRNFIEAAELIREKIPAVHFMLCGEGIDSGNTCLMQWIVKGQMEGCFHLLGIRKDVSRLVAAMDVAVSSSLGEGFPNVVGEAMASSVPCVVTDVGDSALIVADTGRVVPAKDPAALATAISGLLQAPPSFREEMGVLARQRVKMNYSLDSVVSKYEAVFREVVDA